MTGYAHETCDTRVYCPHLSSTRCLCCLSEEDARQKFLDPALIFVKGAKDNRIIHFIQPHIEKTVSEYRSNYQWPEKKTTPSAYVPEKDYMRFESKEDYAKIYPTAKPQEKQESRWNKGIAEQIFDKA